MEQLVQLHGQCAKPRTRRHAGEQWSCSHSVGPNVGIRIYPVRAFDLVTDSDGDAITKYQFWDDNQTTSASDDHPAIDNTGYFTVNGVRQSAGTAIDVSADQLANTNFLKATAGGQEVLWVRAYDGTDWSNWTEV